MSDAANAESSSATAEQPLISVIVPTRNEAENLDLLWERLSAALADVRHEICFVDDSDDATPRMLVGLEEAHPGVVQCVIREGAERVGGLATAVVTGMRRAHGRYICVMDADLQHPPQTINAMLAAAQEGADVVVASRYVGGGTGAGLDGRLRRIVSRSSAAFAQMLFAEARQSSDPLAGFFLCRRELVDGIEFRPVGFKILLELLVCVPHVRVVDVPLEFAPRAGGTSKASMRQGVLFLRHMASLFFRVDGSARRWKFAAVGILGLAIYAAILAVAVEGAGIDPGLAFWIAFLPTALLNTTLNHAWTFADMRRRRIGGFPWRRYASGTLGASIAAFGVLELLVHNRVAPVLAGVVAALLVMLVNGLINARGAHVRPQVWSDIATDRSVTDALTQLAARVDGDRAYVLPPRGAAPSSIPQALIERVVRLRRAATWTEAASHRAQRRRNIDVAAHLILPVVDGGEVVAVVVVEKHSPRGFAAGALAVATMAVETLTPLLVKAAGTPGRSNAAPQVALDT